MLAATCDIPVQHCADAQLSLSEREVRARLARHGRNELGAEKPVPAWKKFFAQFQDMLVIPLLAIAILGLSSQGDHGLRSGLHFTNPAHIVIMPLDEIILVKLHLIPATRPRALCRAGRARTTHHAWLGPNSSSAANKS